MVGVTLEVLEGFLTEQKRSSEAENFSEVQCVVDALKVNGYTNKFIKKLSKHPDNCQPACIQHVYKEFWKKNRKILNQFHVNVAHKPVETAGLILRRRKNKFSEDLSIGSRLQTCTRSNAKIVEKCTLDKPCAL